MDVVVEILSVARDLRQARQSRLVTADEVEPYCPSCAAMIRAGEIQLTRADFEEVIAHHEDD